MSEEQAAPGRKRTPLQQKIAKRAKKVAEAEGVEWKSLSVERRKEIKQTIRQELKEKRNAKKAEGTGAE